jgi:DNA-binding XRE family transcriptional regulator
MNLKKLRNKLKLTQVAFGKKIKTSQSYICSIEKNRRKLGAELKARIMKVFGVKL